MDAARHDFHGSELALGPKYTVLEQITRDLKLQITPVCRSRQVLVSARSASLSLSRASQ